jgi:adenylosuccinate synthase
MLRFFAHCKTGRHSQVCTVVGSQWGDEGKGKLVDILARDYDIIGRFNGGANAGHTVMVGNHKFGFHLLPCGVLYPKTKNVLGNGVVVHFPTLFQEIGEVEAAGIQCRDRIFISDRAHIVTSIQMEADAAQEKNLSSAGLGTTKKGIGPTYSSKMMRIGLRVGDLLHWDTFTDKYHRLADFYNRAYDIKVDTQAELGQLKTLREQIKPMIVDSVYLIGESLETGKRILSEGANALMLDIDYGSYPYVTSSSTGVAGACTGLGIPPSKIQTVIGIVKAYTTRVGAGPFPTEIIGGIGDHLQTKGKEIGVTTGRKRRCGWLDLVVVKYTHLINDYSSINITKLDILDELEEIWIGVRYSIDGITLKSMPSSLEVLSKVQVEYEKLPGWKVDTSNCSSWKDLPSQAKNYLSRISTILGVPVTWVGTGPKRENMLANPDYN